MIQKEGKKGAYKGGEKGEGGRGFGYSCISLGTKL